MHYVFLVFIVFAVGYIGTDKYFSASVAEQDQALSTLSTTVDILLVPFFAIAIFVLLRWLCSTSTGRKLLGLD